MQNILNTYKVSQEKQYSLYKLGYVRNQNPTEFLNKKYIYIIWKQTKKNEKETVFKQSLQCEWLWVSWGFLLNVNNTMQYAL